MKRVHYAWIVLAVMFLAQLASAGARAAPGVLSIPLEREFDGPCGTISLAISINLILLWSHGPVRRRVDAVGAARGPSMFGWIAAGLALGVGRQRIRTSSMPRLGKILPS